MNHKNADKSDCLDERRPPPSSSLKLRMNPAKRKLHQSSPQPQSPQPRFAAAAASAGASSKPTTKRVRSDDIDIFTHPWRCDSEPYQPLPITHHKPTYRPPCYFSSSLNHLTYGEKALQITSYHYALAMQMSMFARAQPQHAVLGDPVQGSQLFNGALEKKKPSIAASDTVADEEDTYISRSGRHVKRRNLNVYEMSSDDEADKEQSMKKAKLCDEPSATATATKSAPAAKRNSKKITNDEIMARSSLFADSPVINKSQRSATLFSKLEETEKENKKAELEKTKFEQSLEQGSDDDDLELITSSGDSPKAVEIEDSDFIRRRIVPPILQRRGKAVNNKYSEMPSTSTSSPANRDDYANNSKTASTSALKSVNGSTLSSPPSKRGPKKKITNCPICDNSFPTKDIEEHASTCGITAELEIESSIPNQRADSARY